MLVLGCGEQSPGTLQAFPCSVVLGITGLNDEGPGYSWAGSAHKDAGEDKEMSLNTEGEMDQVFH